MSGNALEHVVTTSPPTGMPLQATGQSEKLILRPPWRGVLAQKPLMPLAVSSSRSAILTHRFCHTADLCLFGVLLSSYDGYPISVS